MTQAQAESKTYRVLVVDDNENIHSDFKKIFRDNNASQELDDSLAAFLGDFAGADNCKAESHSQSHNCQLEFATQGKEAVVMVAEACISDQPFSLAFVDMRMPPGWDGLRTIEEIWKIDPDIQVVICTAYSDHTLSEIRDAVGVSDKLLIVKKPFDPIEVLQLATALPEKWRLTRQAKEQQEELQRAIHLIEASSEAKSRFIANMSHEIRTPLNGILGLSQVLLREENRGLIETDRETIETIESCGRHLLGLVNEVLDFAQIEAGQLNVSKDTFSIRKLVENTVDVLRARPGHTSEIESNFIGSIPTLIESDERRLKQVLLNLGENACKFSDGGRVDFEVQCDSDEDDLRLRLSIRDNGIGIPEEKLSSILSPFTQADDSITRQFGGFGLGLAIVREIATLLNGSLEIESVEGEGSHFMFTIPVRDVSGIDQKTTEQAKPVMPDLSAKRVLIADDCEINRSVVEFVLEPTNIQVAFAENGQQAIDQVNSQPFDLILMDMQMPIMDGLTATRMIKETNPEIPVLALTANALVEAKASCLEAGCDGFLTKPFEIDDFIDVAVELLEKDTTLA